ncbi:hypothetical protein PIIN_06551 [Serendipita indica DSM 11827]|uniref:Uncharacterized protein n=1 Tax=Serendipita indica (strain DSM 11827) TaxID=1109443 RepID=G4TMS1_SERID|nr:hypothetical protein PIIN_06551 [Serendipita indica DSM 11827]
MSSLSKHGRPSGFTLLVDFDPPLRLVRHNREAGWTRSTLGVSGGDVAGQLCNPFPLQKRGGPRVAFKAFAPSWLISDDHVHHRTKELMVLTFGFVKYKFLCQEHAETGTTPLRLANNKCASCRPHPNSAKRTPNEA